MKKLKANALSKKSDPHPSTEEREGAAEVSLEKAGFLKPDETKIKMTHHRSHKKEESSRADGGKLSSTSNHNHDHNGGGGSSTTSSSSGSGQRGSVGDSKGGSKGLLSDLFDMVHPLVNSKKLRQ